MLLWFSKSKSNIITNKKTNKQQLRMQVDWPGNLRIWDLLFVLARKSSYFSIPTLLIAYLNHLKSNYMFQLLLYSSFLLLRLIFAPKYVELIISKYETLKIFISLGNWAKYSYKLISVRYIHHEPPLSLFIYIYMSL